MSKFGNTWEQLQVIWPCPIRLSFVGLLPIALPPPLELLKRWLFLFGDVGDTWGKDGDNPPPLGEMFIVDECGGLMLCAIDCGSNPTPIIIAGDNWGNPGIPGTIPGGLGRNDDAGDGGSFWLFDVDMEEGVMTVEDIEDNPVNEKHVLLVIVRFIAAIKQYCKKVIGWVETINNLIYSLQEITFLRQEILISVKYINIP